MGLELTHSPQALPGCCKLCGSASRSPFIDTGSSEEFHGAVYYCSECVGAMASLMGYISSDRAEFLQNALKEAEAENSLLKLQVENLERAIDGLVGSGSFPSSGNHADIVLHEASTDSEEGSPDKSRHPSYSAPRTEGELGEGEGTSPESSDDEGMADVHSTELSNDDIGFSLNL